MTTTYATPTTGTLNAFSRCDSCGAQARALWVLGTGELLFCGHHNAKHELALVAQGASQAVFEPFTESRTQEGANPSTVAQQPLDNGQTGEGQF